MCVGLEDDYQNKLRQIKVEQETIQLPQYTKGIAIGLSTWFAVLTIAAVVLLVVVYKRLHTKEELQRPLTSNADEEAAIDDLVDQLAQQASVLDLDQTNHISQRSSVNSIVEVHKQNPSEC